jgi:DNA-binding PadR family transcriptional regulator
MRAEMLKGHLDGMLLAVLSERPMHGYGIVEEFHRQSGGHLNVPSGTLYPALHRLEQAGLVTSRWSAASGRRRREYELTPRGERQLSEHRRSWSQLVWVVTRVLEGNPTQQSP